MRGVLSRHTFPEEPNYESTEAGDAKATYFFISPQKAFCVAEGSDKDGLEPAVASVERVQLVFMGAQESYDRLRPHIGQAVVCRGKLFSANTGHHHSPVLLSDAKCDAAGKVLNDHAPTDGAPAERRR